MKQIIFLSLLAVCQICIGQAAKDSAASTGVFGMTEGKVKALIVGVSDYEEMPDLNYAHSDAKAFYDYLVNPLGGGAEAKDVVLLLNDTANALNFFKGLRWLVDVTEKGDLAIVYFSGLSDVFEMTLKEQGYLLCHDAIQGLPEVGGTVSSAILQAYLNTISEKNGARVMLILDACHAGTFSPASDLVKSFGGVIKILASSAQQFSYEDKRWGGGVFTYYLLNGLSGMADEDTSGTVTLMELEMYLKVNIRKETGNKQIPSLSYENSEQIICNVNAKMLAQRVQFAGGKKADGALIDAR